MAMTSSDPMDRAFIEQRSIVRTIWGDPDLVLLIFAGSAAEFALNRAVDWLFFTNNLPSDPVGRLFSTVQYAQRILFSDATEAHRTMASIAAVHAAVEEQRDEHIPEWSHRDVLYMLIHYSQRSHELLHGSLSRSQKEELYSGFLQLGQGLQIPLLPATYRDWLLDREHHLERDLVYSHYTQRLFDQYRLHLGCWRYQMLLELQALLVPPRVREMLGLKPKRLLMTSGLQMYALIGSLGLQSLCQRAVVPQKYWSELAKLKPAAAWTAADANPGRL
jgi:hypothetical protein